MTSSSLLSPLILSSETPTFLAFTASWCGACKRIDPVLKRLCTELEKATIPFDFVHFDTSQEQNVTYFESFGIAGYPTLLVFQPGATLPGFETSNGIFYRYQGPREVEDIMMCVNNLQACQKQIYSPAPPVTLKTRTEILAMGMSKRCQSGDMGGPTTSQTPRIKLCKEGLNVLAFTGMMWCGHCKEKKPIFDEWHKKKHHELGFHFRQFDDHNKSDMEYITDFHIESFPTFLLFDARSDNPEFFHAIDINDIKNVRPDREVWKQHPPVELVDCANASLAAMSYIEANIEPMVANATQQDSPGEPPPVMKNDELQEELFPAYLSDLAEAIRKQQERMAEGGLNRDSAVTTSSGKKTSANNNTLQFPSIILLPSSMMSPNGSQMVSSFTEQKTVPPVKTIRQMPSNNNNNNSHMSRPTILFVQPILASNESRRNRVQHKMELCGDCVTVLFFTGTWNCDPCKYLRPHIHQMKQTMGHGKYHIVHLERPENPLPDDDVVFLADAFGVRLYPTILIFSPRTKTFYEYKGMREAHHIASADLSVMNVWYHPPSTNDVHIVLKYQQVEIKHVTVHAETNMDLHLCPNCITIICFADKAVSSLSHLVDADGKDQVHVLHFNREQDRLIIDAFRMHLFPSVLVYVPRDGLFFMYRGDVSTHHVIKITLEKAPSREIWKVTPRVVFKTSTN